MGSARKTNFKIIQCMKAIKIVENIEGNYACKAIRMGEIIITRSFMNLSRVTSEVRKKEERKKCPKYRYFRQNYTNPYIVSSSEC